MVVNAAKNLANSLATKLTHINHRLLGVLADRPLVAARHRQAAARTEVVLDIDNQKRVPLADRYLVGQRNALSLCAIRLSTWAASCVSASATSTR